MVIDKFADFRIFAVALRFRSERPNHLRMAAQAALADINVAAQQFEWGVRLDGGDGWHIGLNQIHRNDFNQAANEDGDDRQSSKSDRPRFQPAMGSIGTFFGTATVVWDRLRFHVTLEPAGFRRFVQVKNHQDVTDDVETDADGPEFEHRDHLNNGFEEIGILQEA